LLHRTRSRDVGTSWARLSDRLYEKEKFCMPEANELLGVARQWVQKAENDLKNAAYTLQMGEGCPTDTVCFHAQQCAEKYLIRLSFRVDTI